MLGGDFNAANIDWDTGIVPDSTDNRLMKEKLVTVLAVAGLTQMQRDPTRGQNLLDIFCCNKPSLVKVASLFLEFRTIVLSLPTAI